MDIKQITNQIKCLDEQVKALIIIEDRPTRQEHLKIMKLHIDILKAWAGITSNDASALPIPDVSNRRELLLAFADFLRDDKNTQFIFTSWIDEFLSKQ